MTAPNDDDHKDDPSEQSIPPWLRSRSARPLPSSSAAPRAGDRRPIRSEPFNADQATRDRRSAFAMAPQSMPEPPAAERRGVWRPITGVVAGGAVAAACAYAVIRLTGDRPPATPASATAGVRSREATPPPVQAVPPRLVSTEIRRHVANEAAPLPVKLGGGAVDGTLVIAGLPQGTLISVGTPAEPDRWNVPTIEAEVAEILPPADFVGVMDISIDLVLPSGKVVDRRTARLDWVASPAAARPEAQSAPPSQPVRATPLPADEIAALVEKGRSFLSSGDIASARLMLRRAAEAGDAAAALMLGSTYDPNILGRAAVGVAPDRAQAAQWYQHAANLGSAEARSRLNALPSR